MSKDMSKRARKSIAWRRAPPPRFLRISDAAWRSNSSRVRPLRKLLCSSAIDARLRTPGITPFWSSDAREPPPAAPAAIASSGTIV